MAKHYLNKTRRLAAVLMTSALLCMPLSLLSACDTVEDKEPNTTTNRTDTQKITNANFEFYDTNDGKTVIATAPNGWTKTVDSDGNGSSAASSTSASGIVNTNKSDWDNMTKSKVALTKDNADAEWDKASVYDKIKFYEDADVDSVDDFEKYVAYNVDVEDIPTCSNPGTHSYNAESDQDKDTSVLMIHNHRTDGLGTAQKYTTSTTLNLPAGTAAKVSVWVKTSNLTFNNGDKVVKNRGAYIAVNQMLGENSLKPLTIKNINTEGVTENNGWVQYTVYLKGHNLADSTFTVTLGLGQGGGYNKFEYVEGYAFFDDLTYETMTTKEYAEATKNVSTMETAIASEERNFPVDVANKGETVFAANLAYAETALTKFDTKIAPTVEKYGNTSYSSIPSADSVVYKGLTLDTSDDYLKVASYKNIVSSASSSAYLDKFIDDTKDYPFDEDSKTVLLLSAGGASYTAEVESESFVLAPDSYAILTYYVRTSELHGYTGATAALMDGDRRVPMSAFDTNSIAPVDVDSEEDVNKGWKKCAFLVSNATETDKAFSLELAFGPTSIVGTTNASYISGYAAFTNFTFNTLTEDEFNTYSAGNYVVATTLVDGHKSAIEEGFDTTIYSDAKKIEEGLGTPQNYKGVAGGSSYVGGNDYFYANSNENAGLLNRAYAETYWNNNETWMSTLLKVATADDTSIATALSADNWWSKLFGMSNQPLLIVNTVEQAYGFIGTSRTVSSSSYQSVSVKVKVSSGAVAYLYLMDTSSLTDGYNTPITLKTPTVSYWYDDDNNVCRSDPFDEKFSERDGIAYLYNNNDSTLEHNGLYMSVDESDTKQYANLSAYDKDEDGNLVTESGEVTFYYNKADSLYYAHYDEATKTYKTAVYDFDHSIARYTEETAECVTIVDGNDPTVAGKWITVNYFIHTGSESQLYRLEIFSGSRDGSVKSAADSYVLFDAVPSGSLSTSYDGLLDEAVSVIKEKNPTYKEDDIRWYDNAIYYTYSFHDDDAYERYDEANDSKNVGDLYSGYKQSTYNEVLSYLYYEDTETNPEELTYTTFMDLSAVDVHVASATPDVDDTDDEETEEAPVYNVPLLISSIIMTVVLVGVLLSLLVRFILKKIKTRKVHTTNAYVAEKKQARYKKKLHLKED